MIAAGIKKYKSIIKKKKKKHDKILLLAKSKLNSIEVLISKVLIDSVISHLFIYLFVFNLFIVDKFISVTTRIAYPKQQTSGAVDKIAECWYRWYQAFETKSQFVVLIKVHLKHKRKKKTPYAAK